MNRTHKWPAKALNLLVAVAMVISLVAVLVPAVAAQEPWNPGPDKWAECDPVEQPDGCNLEVFVRTYVKDPVTGDFTWENEFDECNYFYVNAVVVNTGNESTIGTLSAKLMLPASVSRVNCTGNGEIQTYEGTLEPDDPGGDMVDFWWKVHCDLADGWSPIFVDVYDEGEPFCSAMGVTSVNQVQAEETRCVLIEIIEAPGLDYQDYPPSPFEQTVVPCTNFGIKAKITNIDCGPLSQVNGTIRWGQGYNPLSNTFATEDTTTGAFAELVGGDPADGWCVGDLNNGESAIVAWTLHCETPGDIQVLVQAEKDACYGFDGTSLHFKTNYVNDPWTVHQQGKGELNVEINTPDDYAEVCTTCPELRDFTVSATVTNSGDATVTGGYALLTGNGTDLWDFDTGVGALITFGMDLAPGASIPVSWDLVCTDPGLIEFNVHAEGQAAGEVVDADAIVHVWQKEFIASIYEAPTTVNVCQVFDVIGKFENCYQEEDSLTTIEATIWWKGNATLLGLELGHQYQPMYNRCTPWAWNAFTGTGGAGLLNTVIDGPDPEGFLSNTQLIPICECCDTLVRWTFQCLEEMDIEYYVTMEKVVTGPPERTLYDESDSVFVHQVYKAHLIAGVITFLQNECGAMLPRDAFAPCQNFHVVMPVVNVGSETALNVVMTFTVDPAPSGDTWDLVGITDAVTGDAVEFTFSETTGLGTVTLGNIPGNSMRKAILQLHCAGEGQVKVMILDITATHANTGTQIDESNIVIPVCLTTIEQVPFTVEIINPETCETYQTGDRFAVKALITNDSGTDLGNVSATIYIDGNAVLVDVAQFVSQKATKYVGNDTDVDHYLVANSQAEITWELKCTGAGEVFIYVTSSSKKPFLTTVSQTVNVHQLAEPELFVEILSPPNWSGDYATSQEFAVTAMVWNIGDRTAEGVEACIGYDDEITSSASGTQTAWELDEMCISPGSEMIFLDGVLQTSGYTIDMGIITFDTPPAPGTEIWASYLYMVSLVDPVEPCLYLGDIDAGEYKIVTWTLHADTTCESGCGDERFDLSVWAEGTNVDVAWDELHGNEIYPAAHLVVDIDYEAIDTAISVCDEFVVPYTVTNTGQADAWEVSVTLSTTPEGSVRIAEGDWGYTQYIGTITGWGVGYLAGGPYVVGQTYEGTFTVHCKEACESTITITPAGNDECGYFWLAGMCDDGEDCDVEEGWDREEGRPINPAFLEPDSITVKQLESGGLDLGITKTADKSLADPEDFVVWTITVTNYGPTDASGVVVTDAWSPTAELGYDSHAVTQGVFDSGTGVWTVGGLVVGASATLELKTVVGMAPVEAVTNTATITAVDQPDGYTSNDSASATINMTGIELDAGWNLISLPLIPDDSDIEVVMAGVNADIVWAYDAATATWTSWDPVFAGDLTEMVDGKGYWVDMISADTLTVSGVELPLPPATPPTYDVVVGWNLIGFKSAAAMTAGDYLNAIEGEWTRIYGFADGMFQVVQSGDLMQPGFGYWLAAIAEGTIYP